MKSLRKVGLVGVGSLVLTGMLMSFAIKDGGKKKRYQIIHSEKGEVVEYDTLIPMNSNYTVDQFLADKGISNKEVEIINIPSFGDEMMIFDEEMKEGSNVFIKEIHSESDGEGEREMEVVKIIKEENDNGEVTIKKIVNSEEVEMTAEDLKTLEAVEGGNHEGMKVIKMEIDEDSIVDIEGDSEVVKIICELDDDGNMKAQKFVNGKEVELTKEELEQFKVEEGKLKGEHKVIRIDMDSDGELDENMEIQIEKIIEEIHEEHGTEGSDQVIIKRIDVDGEEDVNTWISSHTDSQVEVISEGKEDFTIVLVSEDLDENAKVKVKTKRK